MKVLRPGHRYQLANFEEDPLFAQVIQFIEKEPDPQNPLQFKTVFNGTTNEDVLEVLIDRINTMNKKVPCRENAIVLTHLETALLWLHKRTEDRKKRGVEGKPQS